MARILSILLAMQFNSTSVLIYNLLLKINVKIQQKIKDILYVVL